MKGLIDVLEGLKSWKLAFFLAFADIRQRYRRSTLGPFWITISTAVMVACLGLIFGSIFKSPLKDFLPFLATGLIIWSFISSSLTEATTVFLSSQAVIKQLPLPLFVHVLRMVFRNFYIFLHNIVIIPFVLILVQRPIGCDILCFLPGLLILAINLLWMSLLLGIICSRFSDLTQIVISCLQIVFYVTPIIWMPALLPARESVMVLQPNPFYHLMEIVRSPIMNIAPTSFNWLYSLILLLLGWTTTILIYNKCRSKIAYWL